MEPVMKYRIVIYISSGYKICGPWIDGELPEKFGPDASASVGMWTDFNRFKDKQGDTYFIDIDKIDIICVEEVRSAP